MKRIISVLLMAQLLIISLYGLTIYKSYLLNNFLKNNTSMFTLAFENADEVNFFMDLTNQNDLTVTRVVYKNEKDIHVYTTDLSMGNSVSLRTGRFPFEKTSEFVSTVVTNEDNQTGTIHSIVPNLNISIRHINDSDISNGIYYINTADVDLVRYLIHDLSSNIYHAQLLNSYTRSFFWLLGNITINQLIEMAVVMPLLSLCVFIALVQYSIQKLKHSSILMLHGFSKYKIVHVLTLNVLKPIALSIFTTYLILVVYASLAGFNAFIIDLSLYYLMLCVCLVLFYILTINIFILWYLYKLSAAQIIKGRKPYFAIQVLNRSTKMVFTSFLLISIFFTMQNLDELNERINKLDNWEIAQNAYWPKVTYIGQWDLAIDFQLCNSLASFYDDMAKNYNGFIMNHRNVLNLELGLMPYKDMGAAPSMRLSPNGYNVTISPNFLNINPIKTVNGFPIQEQIIYDDYLLNILVPVELMPYHDEITTLYLDEFYYKKVTVDNIYNNEFGLAFNATRIDELNLNIIYVENEQYYFSFDSEVSLNSGNKIKDPIAIIYTGNIHVSALSHHFSNGFYYYTNSNDHYHELQPILIRYGLENAIQEIEAVYDFNGRVIDNSKNQYTKMMLFTIILIIANFTITYSLVANYFERNKQKIFLRSLFGYDGVDRNKSFIIMLTIYNVLIATVFGIFLGSTVLFIGLVFMFIDLIIALVVERILLSKSFSEIMKGER